MRGVLKHMTRSYLWGEFKLRSIIKVVILCMFLCLMLVVCNKKDDTDDVVKIQVDDIYNNNENSIVKQAIGEVMLDKAWFYTGGVSKALLSVFYEPVFSVDKFTIVDMNADGILEVVVWYNNDLDDLSVYLVLHYDEGKVQGFNFTSRDMMNLKTDGTYSFWNKDIDNGCGNLSLTSASFDKNILAYSKSGLEYSVLGEIVTEEEFDSYMDEQDAKTDLTWYDFNKQDIENFFINSIENE